MNPVVMPNDDFQHIPLRAHAILHAARLMDVWAVPLRGGGPGRTVQDVIMMIENSSPTELNPGVRGLFWLREMLGRVFGWEAPRDAPPTPPAPQSYVHRLPPELAAASHLAPGTQRGPLRVLYQLDDELLAEVLNATAHAFVSFTLRPQDNSPDYLALVAVYVIETKWWTRYYLALIEPFRHYAVYPSLMRTFQRRWAAHHAR
jgi:hypothetical protein